MTKVKGKPPSRTKYEQENPTFSCRISREIYDRLQAIRTSEDMSYSAILKIGLGMIEPKAKENNSMRKTAFAGGYREGYGEGCEDGYFDAEMALKVTFPCFGCGKTMEVNTEQLREAAGRCLQEKGWGHLECVNSD